MLKKILIVLAILIVAFVIVVLTRPNEYRVARSAKVAAPAATVFPLVNDFHNWETWSPWAKVDPAMKVSYEGPVAGVGAIYSWVGNDDVGEGRATIVESRPNELIRIKLEFFKPFAGVAEALYTFKTEGAETEVTWSMSGQNNFLGKAIGLFINMDKMLGSQFEKGLAQMKQKAEGK